MAKKILNILSTLLLIVLVAIVVFVFITRLSGESPSIFGYHIFRVSSGSMEPTLMVGDVIVVRACDPDEIQKGDIITYKSVEGDMKGSEITHLVVEEPYEEDGVWHYQTKGIAEGVALDRPITYDQVEGKYIRTLPFVNKLYTFFLSPYGLITFIFIIIALFGYEMVSLFLSYRSIDEHDDDYYAPKAKKKSKKRKK